MHTETLYTQARNVELVVSRVLVNWYPGVNLKGRVAGYGKMFNWSGGPSCWQCKSTVETRMTLSWHYWSSDWRNRNIILCLDVADRFILYEPVTYNYTENGVHSSLILRARIVLRLKKYERRCLLICVTDPLEMNRSATTIQRTVSTVPVFLKHKLRLGKSKSRISKT